VRAVKADPRNLEAYDLLGRLREAMGTVGENDETARVVRAAIKRLDPDSRRRDASRKRKRTVSAMLDEALTAMATARFNRDQIPDRAAVDGILCETLDRADMLKSKDRGAAVRAAVLRAQVLEADGNIEEAGETLRQLSERAPNIARIWFERGGLACRRGEIAVAVEAFERATLLDPQEAYAYQSLRFAFDGYRRYRTERVRFEYATRLDPRDALAHYHMGLAAMSVLKNDEALFHFNQALELDPRLAEAACGCARVYQRRGDLSASATSYRQALGIDANCQEARVALQQLAHQTASAIFLQDPSESGRNEQR
jgi:tetratricopeptide (TPR) repeat protein